MNPNLATKAQAVLNQLNELINAATTTPANVDTARLREQAIRTSQAFLEDRAHNVVFVGSVGIGKSSVIGVLANLLLGPVADRTSLKDNSVLAIGSGRTTVCEVRVRGSISGDEGEVGLIVDPFSVDEFTKEIEIYAQSEWTRRQSNARGRSDEEADPTSQEVHRAIRGMAGYAEYQEVFMEAGLKRRRNVRPLDDAIREFGSPTELAEHLLERVNLPARVDKKAWWWESFNEESLLGLKKVFEAVNQGLEPTAMLPRRMTVIIPNPLPGSQHNLQLTLVDTRGLDGRVEARRDIQELLRDRRAIVVLCAPFKDAPGDTPRALLRSMATDAELQDAIPRTHLVVLDQGDAEQVNGANGDREFGQSLKTEECHIALDAAGPPRIDRAQIVAFDTVRDDRGKLLSVIDDRLGRLRASAASALDGQIADAESFLSGAGDEALRPLRELVDRKIREALARYPLSGVPLTDPLVGLYDTIRGCRYASVVYATCRRNGLYGRLDLYAAVNAEAAKAATTWMDEMMTAILRALEELAGEPSVVSVGDHIRLRKMQFEDGRLKVIRGYADRVGNEVENLLKADPVWATCCGEWGSGNGFKDRVLGHLEAWARRQELAAHERTDALQEIPFLADVVRAVQSPLFTLYVRNLRALRVATWTPEPVSILIGANGAGKTTLLQTLRFLRLAYERGLPEAAAIVLGGSANIKSWGASEQDAVEIGIDVGGASWRIELISREGSVDYITNERLTDGPREVFSRDSLGNFVFGGERVDAGRQTGLRALMDRGVHDQALRRIAGLLQGISVYHEPDLWTLRNQGSRTTEDRFLDSRGTNALTLLRRWSQDRAHRDRFQFVVDGLSAAFPGIASELGFIEAGNTLVARVYRQGVEQPSPLSNEAHGVLQLLVLFCDVASADDGSVLAIDEPENGLHPYALRVFLRRAIRWAELHNLTVLLATHSTVLLDYFTPNPEQVFVMKSQAPGAEVPTRLDELYDRDWLAGFKLGDLYEQSEIGSNKDNSRA